MKLNKKKVFTLALAVCLIAILSMGSLAWFTDSDAVQNDFHVAGSEDDADSIFSVDVWEEKDDGTHEDTGKTYTDILPGDVLGKVAHVENTGSYDQYIRVKITVSDAAVWQDVYNTDGVVDINNFVNVDLSALAGLGQYQVGNSFVYYLYYEQKLPVGGDYTLFTEAYIAEGMDQYQAAALVDGYTIDVYADAVQTENVGDGVEAAFATVGMVDETNAITTKIVSNATELMEAIANGYDVILVEDIVMTDGPIVIG